MALAPAQQPRHTDDSRVRPAGLIFFAGRLADYVYIDLDDCMRQALDTAAEVRDALGAAVA